MHVYRFGENPKTLWVSLPNQSQSLPQLADQPATKTDRRIHGFTLIELLVVLAIIGILVGLLLPAVQSVREASRKVSCQNRIKNLDLATLSFESTHERFPHGASFQNEISWAVFCLPWLGEENLHDRFDFSSKWNEGANFALSQKSLPIFSCPTSHKTYDGKTDYSGISGSWRTEIPIPRFHHNGIFYPAALSTSTAVEMRTVIDGTSNTICIAEGAEVLQDSDGFWANGKHCFSHEEGGVNASGDPSDEITSEHSGGAFAGFCDGSIRFLSDEISAEIVAALCTRNGYETNHHF